MFNRKAALLTSLSLVLCCSPVCEKQALFAILQSYKENDIEEQLIKKVWVWSSVVIAVMSNQMIIILYYSLQMLGSVSKVLGYRNVKTFISSHLHYLVAEWLALRQSDDRYTLGSFPYSLLDNSTVEDFYK